MHGRLPLGSILLITLLAACSGGDAGVVRDEPVRQEEEWRTDFDRRTVDLAEIVSGGPPKDGIPAIDQPNFVSVAEADGFLGDNEPVAVVRRNGESKAYPIQILIWHEIVNDVVGGDPVTVTYCPLCNTTLAFDRRFEDLLLDFGTTGRLRHSDLVMYDRQTETWWQQATGEGIVGEHAGKQLTFVSSPVMRWRDVKDQLQQAEVLSKDTGYPFYIPRYGSNPYQGYDSRGGPMDWTFQAEIPGGVQPMERVVALHEAGDSWAIPFSELADAGFAEVELNGRDVVVFFEPETASSVDARLIAEGRSVGSSAVYEASLDGTALNFERNGNDRTFRDRETGSIWNLSGQAVSGELEGAQLEEVPHGNHFWFAWAVFRPETKIWEN